MISDLPAFDQLSSLSRLNSGTLPFLPAAWKGSTERDGAEQERFPVAKQGHSAEEGWASASVHITPFSSHPSPSFLVESPLTGLFLTTTFFILTVPSPRAGRALCERSLDVEGDRL